MVQKCKVHWLKEGDENSKFFHQYLAARKRKALISELKNVNGIYLLYPRNINAEIIGFSEDLYRKGPRQHYCIQGLPSISHSNKAWLERKFGESEILHALKALGKNKAPGLTVILLNFLSVSGSI